MSHRFIGAVAGVVLGLQAPLLWMLWRAYDDRRAWWMRWVKAEFDRNGDGYLVLGAVAVASLAILGCWIGGRYDELEEVSVSAQDSNLELTQMAATDGLTGLFNGRYMRERLVIELENAYRSPLSSLMIDIDHFKKINDRHGHPFGDEVLVGVAAVLRRCVRRIDAVGRVGGEEFLVLLPDTPVGRAAAAADRIRAEVEAASFEAGEPAVRVTVSIGVATSQSPGLQAGSALWKAADDALYRAKREGRNRTIVWRDPSEESGAA